MALLDPYSPSPSKPWNAKRVAHLYARLGFSATNAEIQAGLALSPAQLVDKLLDEAVLAGPLAAPVWADWRYSDYVAADPDPNVPINAHRSEMFRRWPSEMADSATTVRAKMVLFWSNLLVTGVNTYQSPPYQWHYWRILNERAFGNFRELAIEIGRSAAMLVYLNGNISVASEPNENYARELMELFTMGENNGYAQADIVEMARALTGWRCDENNWNPPHFDPALWDAQPKTVFGKVGNYDFEGAHDLIFQERSAQVASFVPKKIYRAFVYRTENAAVVAELGQTFEQSGWEIMPVLKRLFKSEHFFDDDIMASLIKSPMEMFIGLIRSSDVSFPDWTTGATVWNDLAYWASALGQLIFDPPNVAGWPGQRNWLTESTLTNRWAFSFALIGYFGAEEQRRERLRALAIELTGASKNPYIITSALIEHFLRQELPLIPFEAAVKAFKAGIPENYFIDGSWNLDWNEAPFQALNLLTYLVRLPEFQLN